MSEEQPTGRPSEPSQPTAPAGGDEVAEWAAGALGEVDTARSGAQGSAPQNDTDDAALEAGVANMLGQVANARRPRRSKLWTGVWTLVGLLVIVAVLAVLLDVTGTYDFSCANEQEEVQAGYQTQSPDRSSTSQEPASQGQTADEAYFEARTALGLSNTPPESVSAYNSGSGPLKYAFTWVDDTGSVVGSIGTLVLTRDEALGNGRATIEGSDTVGAYKMGKAAGANVAVDIAVRIPGPDGGEPRLVIFNTENTASFTLTGTARPADADDPASAWKVAGTLVKE